MDCSSCGAPKAAFTCGHCKRDAYCGEICQEAHWDQSHGLVCLGDAVIDAIVRAKTKFEPAMSRELKAALISFSKTWVDRSSGARWWAQASRALESLVTQLEHELTAMEQYANTYLRECRLAKLKGSSPGGARCDPTNAKNLTAMYKEYILLAQAVLGCAEHETDFSRTLHKGMHTSKQALCTRIALRKLRDVVAKATGQ